MGNIDDEFKKMVEGLLPDPPEEDEEEVEFQTFSSLYLVENLGHLSRSLAFLIEFMEVSMEHVAQGEEGPRPALTTGQVEMLQELFKASSTFNDTVIRGNEDDDGSVG